MQAYEALADRLLQTTRQQTGRINRRRFGLSRSRDLAARKELSVRPPTKSVFLYDSGEFVGSARVGNVKHKRLASGGVGPLRAGEILNRTDLKRLKLDPSTIIYVR
jgi:hypothetical protein